MNELSVIKAANLLAEIEELLKYANSPKVVVSSGVDWNFGSGVCPRRAAMVDAVKDAADLAESILITAAKRQISNLRQELKNLGVESPADLSPK